MVYHRPDQKEWGFAGGVTEDGNYLIISVWRGTDPKNLLFYKDLRDPNSPVVELICEFQAEYSFVGNDGSRFWLLTDFQAPRRRLVALDLDSPGQLQEVIPEAEETLQGVSLIHNQFVAFYLKDAHTQIKTFALDGTYQGEIPLPGLGSASGFGGKRYDTETFYTFTSFTTPPTIYRYDFTTGGSTLFRQPQVDFDPQAYEVQQVFYASKDGTRIPMFLVHRRGLARTGDHPTLLYGYGGFGISLTPSFSVGLVAWLEMGEFTPSPICAAAANMGKPGTRRAPSSTSKRSLTTSSPRLSG